MRPDANHDFVTLAATEDESTPESPYSSNVRRVDFWDAERVLVVAFKSGTYRYEDVNARVWMQLKAERNKMGQAVNRLIVRGTNRDGQPYKYSKVEEDPNGGPTELAIAAPEEEARGNYPGDGTLFQREHREASDRRKSRRG